MFLGLTPFPAVPIFNCLSHSRLLLQLTQSQQSSFVLENNRKGQKEIDDEVARLGFDENSLQLMTKVRGCFIVCRVSVLCVDWLSSRLDTPLS